MKGLKDKKSKMSNAPEKIIKAILDDPFDFFNFFDPFDPSRLRLFDLFNFSSSSLYDSAEGSDVARIFKP